MHSTQAARRTWLLAMLAAPVVVAWPSAQAQGAASEAQHESLRDAARRNDLATFNRLVAAGADVNARDAQQDSAFLIACREGHTAIVRAALAAGADVKSLNRYGSTALMGPSYRGHRETVRVLVGTTIDIHHVNNLGWTALLEAIVLGRDGPTHHDIVRLLIARGSNVNQPDREGVTPLQHAERRGQVEVARMLRAAGAGR